MARGQGVEQDIERVAGILHRSMLAGPGGHVRRHAEDPLDYMVRFVCNGVDGSRDPYSATFRKGLFAACGVAKGTVNRDLASTPTNAPFLGGNMTALRCSRWAWSLVHGRPGDIPGTRRSWVGRALSTSAEYKHLAAGLEWEEPAGPRSSPVIPFRYAHKPSLGAVAKASHLSMAAGSAHVRLVDRSDAPIVANLRTPEGTLDLRMVDGVLMRPVLAPDSWSPIGAAEFREAAWGSPAWVDNPFLPRPAWNASVADLEDVAFASTAAGAREDRAAAAALRGCLLRAASLADIGGVMHVASPEPRFHLACRTAVLGMGYTDPMSLRLAWRLGDIDMFTSMSTDRCVVEAPVGDVLGGAPCYGGAGMPPAPVDIVDLGFGLGDAAALRRLGEELVGALRDRSHAVPPVRLDDDPVAWFDPAVFPSNPLAATDLLVELGRSDHPVWSVVGPKGFPAGPAKDWAGDDLDRMATSLDGLPEALRLHANGEGEWAQRTAPAIKSSAVFGLRLLCEAALAELDATLEPEPDLDEDVAAFKP